MFHQDNVQTFCIYPPVLYSAYEREHHESQFEHGKEKKWYEEPETGRALVAPCDAWDRASRICCGSSSGEGNADGCSTKSDKGNQNGREHDFIVVPKRPCSEDDKALGAKS